jgi:thioredoxin 1
LHGLDKNIFICLNMFIISFNRNKHIMADLNVSDATFQADVLDAKGLVLVDFWAAWCMPCQILGPVIEEIAQENKEKVSVKKLDVDANQQTSMKYQVMSIPTVLLFKDGEVVETFIGVQPKQVYVDAIEKHS